MEFSVIIPTYNRARFIGRAIRSAVNQDCIPKSEIEIVVIDDGSDDDTEQVVKSIDYKGTVLNYIKTAHVGQPGTARNTGLDASKGDFIAYLDSDDFWFPHHLATAKQEFKANPDLLMVMTYWGFARFRADPYAPDGVATKYEDYKHPVDPHGINTAVNTNCRVHRRHCTDLVGKFNTSRWGEDQDFFDRIWNRYRDKCKKVHVVTNVCGYIVGGNNLTYEYDANLKRRFF